MARITSRWLLRGGIGDLALTKTEGLVLLALLDHIDRDGIAWRPQTKLAQDLRISRQQINEAQGRLRERGLLIEVEAGRQGRATRYRFGDTNTLVASGDRIDVPNMSDYRGKLRIVDMSPHLAGGI